MNIDPIDPRGAAVGRRRPVDAMVLRKKLTCRDCGYDLRGLVIGGACPECGTPVWQTLLQTIDPATSRLPRLRNPSVVGNAVLLIACSLLLVPVLLGLGPALRAVAGLLDLPGPTEVVVDWYGWAAAAVAAFTLIPIARLAPRRDDEAAAGARRRLLLMAIGFGVTSMAIAVLVQGGWYRIRLIDRPWYPEESFCLGILATCILGGLMAASLAFGGVLRTVGERSREYRVNLAARQGTRELAIALAVVLVAEFVRLSASPLGWSLVGYLFATLAITAFSMAIIGYGYLTLNCFWIRRSLRRPPPTILELIFAHRPSEVQEEPSSVIDRAESGVPPERP